MSGRIELPEVPELELAPEKPPQGPRVWMEENLFSTRGSTILTLAGLVIAWVMVKGFAGFIFDFTARRWDMVTLNMRLLMVQAYPAGDNADIIDAAGVPIDQFHRIWISLGIVVALALFSFVFWQVGSRISRRSVARVFMGIGAFVLFTFLGVPIIDYTIPFLLIAGGAVVLYIGFNAIRTAIGTSRLLGDLALGLLISLPIGVALILLGIGSIDFGGWEWQFSGKVHFWTILVGALLVLVAWALQRDEASKEPTMPMMGILGFLAVVVAGLLWVIKVPVPSELVVGAPKAWAGIATSTKVPWTIILLGSIVVYFLAMQVRRFVPEKTGRRVLSGLWLLSFPFLAMVVLRDPGFGEEYAPGFSLGQYLALAVGFLIVGGAVIALASHPAIGEWAAAISGILGVAIIYTWGFTSTLFFIRFLLVMLLVFVLGAKTFGSGPARNRYLMVWGVTMVLFTYFYVIAKGGTTVDVPLASPFGGFLLTLVVFLGVTLLSFPLGVILALGRTSTMPIFRLMSVAYIEVVRAVPLITWLIMSIIFLPFALPLDAELDRIVGVILFYAGFSAAYLAENVRGGLQAIREGQKEASKALGMTTVQTMIFITMPQALRTVIPALVGGAIATFKDTSLVTIISLFDFLHISRFVIPNSTLGRASVRTTLLFAAVFYWVFTFAMSRASLRLEKKLGVGER
ncbi:MAG: amino acid ABC transporter permease [Acidimicrobiia bacterium]|nr:amino acid ABC transporter permease [Acidimicrobiia bacterium]MBT8193639.1 amino acid ABC transporter permease [Acidimicrobiia bacterium]MBT8247452.1 amino acid ABC transporter permease [Acidimicrobiia bacterium]NNF89483.1 amino acid ABC transporter permease [Acidimicrobiia bacterium]NNL12483.1 amino acid ABC transporter permease [Acidimicrobiia bacterium]